MSGEQQNLRTIVSVGQAAQDQEITEAVDWLKGSEWKEVVRLWDWVNDAESGMDMRRLTNTQLLIVRNMAMVGFFEVFKSAVERGVIK